MRSLLVDFRRHAIRAASICRDMLREIFDESAYRRFLARNHQTSSPNSYAAFLREQAQMLTRRHRCC